MTGPSERPSDPRDVRMRGFPQRTSVTAARHWLDSQAAPLEAESVELTRAAGRVLAEDVVSPVDVPGFARAMMDGYAVRAEDCTASSERQPVALRVVGEALPNQPFLQPVRAGEAVRIMTGAPLPEGADAVLPVERVEQEVPREAERIRIRDTITSGKHVGRPGEDIRRAAVVLRRDRVLRPQDVGLLSSIGVGQVQVVRRPRVRIVVTGNELLPPGSTPKDYQIVDANSPMLAALIERDGGLVRNPGILPDQPDAILEALRDPSDVILVSGGSSVGAEDHAPRLLARHGELAVHGIAMRPGSPTGLGRLEQRLVVLLPGNPVACLCAYDLFAGRAIRALGGRPRPWPYPVRRLPLRDELASAAGRVDYARVRLVEDQVEPLAIRGGSALSSTCQADGFLVIPADCEGYAAGELVDVFSYDFP